MPRRDLNNRDELGNWKPRYREPLSDRKTGVYFFASDQIAIEEIAAEIDVTPTELVREIVRRWVVSQIDGRSDRDILLFELKEAIHPTPSAGKNQKPELT